MGSPTLHRPHSLSRMMAILRAILSPSSVSAVACFALMCLLFYFGFLHYFTNQDWLREASSYSSGVLHQLEFTRGLLDTRPVVFYLSGTVVMLFFTIRILEARRW